MMWYWGSSGWGMTAVGILMMVVFWGGALALIVTLVRGAASPRADQQDAALAVLRKRLAAGEISPEDYERVRRLIGG